jgi:hypothetical protein
MDIPQLSADQYAIQWPEPAHARFGDDAVTVEPCDIEFRNGTSQSGDLLHFTGREPFLVFRPSKDHPQRAQMIAVKLANVRQLRLTRSVELLALEESQAQSSTELSPSEVQVYNVEFADGEITSGETVGYAKLPVGLFLFFLNSPNHVLRHFVPSDMIAYSQIGDPIGKVLVEEHLVSEAQLQVAVEKQQEMRRLVLGDYLIEEGYITAEQLNDALEYQKKKPSLRVGEALIEMGYVTSDALQAALARQRANRGRPLSQILLDMGLVDRDTLDRVQARKHETPVISLSGFRISADAVKLIPPEVAKRLNVLPLAVEDGALIVAVTEPPNSESVSELGLLARMRVVPVIADGAELAAKQTEAYGSVFERIVDPESIGFASPAGSRSTDTVKSLLESGNTFEVSEGTNAESERVLTALFEKLAKGTLGPGTLDIHIESDGTSRKTHISFKRS